MKEQNRQKINQKVVEDGRTLLILIHDQIIEKTGGEGGVRDEAGLYHSTFKILQDYYCVDRDPYSIGAMIYKEIAQRHHFFDGNKRTAHCVAKVVLLLMRKHLFISYKDAISFIIDIADHEKKKTIKEIKQWIQENTEEARKKSMTSYLKELYDEIIDAK